MTIRILTGDCRDVLKTLPDASVQCCVTSPPYFNLRNYGVEGQIGLESSPAEYVAQMVAVFREVRRVLRDDGICWINLGDSYAGHNPVGFRPGNEIKNGGASNKNGVGYVAGLKPKDLIGIPWAVAFALRDDGWWLRQDNIWAKRNCMPESVRDRTTRAHEYMFMLTKSERYFYDATAIEEEGDIPAGTRAAKGGIERAEQANGRPPEYAIYTGKRNKRSVWWVATQPYSEAHFATFPPDLIEPCILAGTSERGCCAACGAPWVRQVEASPDTRKPYVTVGTGAKAAFSRNDGNGPQKVLRDDGRGGDLATIQRVTTGWLSSCQCDVATVPCVVLDPFGGAFTTALVADRLRRDAIGIELNPLYCDMARRRIEADAGMFAEMN